MSNSNNQYMVEAFSASNKEKKLEILEKLGKEKDENLLPFFISCLSDEYWVIRKAAADLIRGYGESVTNALSNALNSYNQDIQHWSLLILSEIGSKGFPAILRAVKSNNEEIRYFACVAIGNSKPPQGVTLLLRALGDERWRVRKAASDALIKYGEAVIAPLQQVLKTTNDEDIKFWTIKTLGKLGSKAQHFLLEAIKSGDKRLRYVIAAALGESGDQRVIRVLIESLSDPDWTIRKSATMALSEIGESAFDLIMDYIVGPNEDIRDGCLRAVVRSGNKGLQRLFDEIVKMDDNQRFLIRNSLIKIGSQVVEPLIRLFKLQDPEVLAFSASTLGEIGNPRAVPVLITGLSHSDWNVRRSSAYALGEIGERGVDKIAEALKSPNDDVRYWITRILEGIGEAGVPYLIQALKDSNREIRYFAAQALGSSSDPSVAKALMHTLGDEVWGVRKVAAESICKLDNLQIGEILRQIANDNGDIKHWIRFIIGKVGKNYIPEISVAIRKGDPELRLHACQAASMTDSSELVEPLIIALRDDNEWVRTYAAISLGKIGDQRAIVPLIQSFSDRNSDLNRHVKQVFENLGDKVFDELIKCIEGNDLELKCNATRAIAEMRYERGLDHILMLMEDSNTAVRITTAEALGSFSGLKSRAILSEALKDESIQVKVAAIKSIGNLGEKQDIARLMEHIGEVKDQIEFRTIKRTLADMALNNPNLFIELFSKESNIIKNLTLEALVTAGLPVMATLTEAMADSRDEILILWCKKAIKQIKAPRETIFYG